MQSLIEKSIARFLAVKLVPECSEILSLYRSKRDGWIKMPAEFEQIRKNSGLGDLYVIVYEDEPRILACLIRALFPGEAMKEFNQFNDELVALPEKEKIDFMDLCFNDFLSNDSFQLFKEIFHATEEEREAAQLSFEALPEDQKQSALISIQLFIAFIYAYFYNHIALMVHGQKMTTLVSLALQGDQKAFCKAVQIDRNLLTGHPYFRDIYAKLQTGEDRKFLVDVLSHLNRPPIQGKIRYPALYSLFATLDGFGSLNDFTATEIMDMCDEVGLDRYQNRIEDENYLIKRRLDYRKKQKIGF